MLGDFITVILNKPFIAIKNVVVCRDVISEMIRQAKVDGYEGVVLALSRLIIQILTVPIG